MILALLSQLALAGDCAVDVAADRIATSLSVAEAAFTDLDVERFTRTMDDLSFALPCVREPIAAELATRVHRMEGIRQFVARNEERAVRAFAASRASAPDAELPERLVPPGHAIRDLYARFPLDNGGFRLVPEPRHGELRIDGVASLERPDAWPAVVQLIDRAGAVVDTAYLYPTDALPPYEARPARTGPIAGIRWIRSGKQLALLGTSALSALAAGALYGVAAVGEARYKNPDFGTDWNREQAQAHRIRTNGLTIGAGVLGLTAVSTGVLAGVSGRW